MAGVQTVGQTRSGRERLVRRRGKLENPTFA
jgi:hypothetical protein